MEVLECLIVEKWIVFNCSVEEVDPKQKPNY